VLLTTGSRNSEKRGNQIHPLGLRIKTDLSAVGFKHLSLLFFHGCLNDHSSIYLLSSFAKAETIPEVFKSKFLEICDGLQGLSDLHRWIKNEQRHGTTAAAAVSGDIVKSLRITSHASIFTAELVALNLALDIIGSE